MSLTSKDAWEKSFAERLARFSLTSFIVFVLLMLSAFPFKIGDFGEIRPAFLLMAVYYWAIFRPSMLPPSATFAAGLLQDLLSGFPPGMTAATLVIVQHITRNQRKLMLGQHFVVIWAVMQLLALCVGIAQWMVYSLLEWHIMPLKPVFTSALMTGVFFPLAALPLYALNRAIERRR